ncbi:MAG: type II toxin-antitoxin system RelE/ParE family toxin [Cyclobacteriaceae bacterium]|nr:type II toxin-antitoxin system RelE/ParE family toxin [Cyclobacteriaceae bacterium]
MEREIVWNKRPSKYLTQALKRISEESYLQAERVEEAILTRLEKLKQKPEKYPTDKFKRNNQGNYRAFETHSYRIAYRFTDKEIRILRIRHVKQEPKEY